VTDLREPDDVIVMFSDGGSRRYDVVADSRFLAMRRRLFATRNERSSGRGGGLQCRERNPYDSWAIKESRQGRTVQWR